MPKNLRAQVRATNGYHMTCTRGVPHLSITLGMYTLIDDFYVIELEDTNVVLVYNGCIHWEDS